MEKNEVAELIKKAKGEDRSLREYSRASGVDVAIISKIINGNYLPKKLEIYRNLTRDAADPRGGVTYEQVVKALNPTSAYLDGLQAGKLATEAILSKIGMLQLSALSGMTTFALSSVIEKSNKQAQITKYEKKIKEIQRFVAIANGVIYGKLISSGIAIKDIKPNNEELLGNRFDTVLRVESQALTEYILRYIFLSADEIKEDFLVKNTSRRIVEELVFLPLNSKRKISLVTNSNRVYDYVCNFKGKLSYNGNLSVLLFDEDKTAIIKEEYLAYCNNCTENEIIIVKDCNE